MNFNLTDKDIITSAGHFDIEGNVVRLEECHNGHINRTYFLTYDTGKRYVMQMVNTSIFKKPDEVMENIVGVTEHIRHGYEEKGIDPERRTLRVIWTKSGKWGHVVISKRDVSGATETSVALLDSEGRVTELSRILGGIDVTASQRAAAEDMLREKSEY